MAKDDRGREGLSAGSMTKELGVSPTKVERTLGELGDGADDVKSGGTYRGERSMAVEKALARGRG